MTGVGGRARPTARAGADSAPSQAPKAPTTSAPRSTHPGLAPHLTTRPDWLAEPSRDPSIPERREPPAGTIPRSPLPRTWRTAMLVDASWPRTVSPELETHNHSVKANGTLTTAACALWRGADRSTNRRPARAAPDRAIKSITALNQTVGPPYSSPARWDTPAPRTVARTVIGAPTPIARLCAATAGAPRASTWPK